MAALNGLEHQQLSSNIDVIDVHVVENSLENSPKRTLPSMSFPLIKVTVKLFAAYQEAYGVPELMLEFPQGTTVATVRDCLIDEYPQLEQWRNVTRFGINFQFVDSDTELREGDEVVLIPPVSGG